MTVLGSYNFARGRVFAAGSTSARRAPVIAAGHEALLASGKRPDRVSYVGCRSEADCEWVRLGGRIEDLHAMVYGSDEEAVAALTAVGKQTGKTVNATALI